ncbi:MAG TPA: bacterial transcriptional activator domain-containing protein [Spirochaetia bacterium]|nr:bacterial transcriptional activator domain-containing protein [Spirochaetia bacterium]
MIAGSVFPAPDESPNKRWYTSYRPLPTLTNRFFRTSLCRSARLASPISFPKANSPYAAAALEQAAGSYAGEFLPEDIYEDWTTSIRCPLRDLHLEVLFQLARVYQAKGNWAAALQTCRRYLASEPVAEPVVRLAMEILWQSGNRKQALSMYSQPAATLAGQYDARPESQTAALNEKIHRGGQ